jgi:opacity protein-like surface antigen
MKKFLLAALLAFGLALPAAAQRSGVYNVTGTNPDGTDYTGTMMLQQVGLASFRIVWTIGGDNIEGVGMVSGLTLATAFTLANNQTGMGIYEIKPGDVLEGVWTVVGAFAAGRETARPR